MKLEGRESVSKGVRMKKRSKKQKKRLSDLKKSKNGVLYKRFPKGDDIKSNLSSNDRRGLPAAARWMVSRKRNRCGESKNATAESSKPS